jgi:DNA-binding PadR family transcriptional regulator
MVRLSLVIADKHDLGDYVFTRLHPWWTPQQKSASISATDVSNMEPLTPAVFHILLALADQDRHGYGIMQEIAARTKQDLLMGPGTLYGTLKRMLEAGFIEECGEHIDPELNIERRRYYRLTRQGRRAATTEAQRLHALVRMARAKAVLKTA